MNIKSLSEKARLCVRSEAMIAEILVASYVRKIALSCLAILTTLTGLVFLNIAAFAYLQTLWGPVLTPFVIGLGNFILAGLSLAMMALMQPGPDLAMARELRRLSINTLEEEFQSDQGVGGLFGPLAGEHNSNIAKLLLPAVISIVGSLSRRRAKG